MVTGSGFGASRLPQNLGSGQREQGHPSILEAALRLQNGRKDVSYTRRRAVPTVANNDDAPASVAAREFDGADALHAALGGFTPVVLQT